ncbi:MAG: flavin reductase family protein [Planctomycetaceae bacterium]|nr:flavin reductase family protein [Planctomycetaceae bacterium]
MPGDKLKWKPGNMVLPAPAALVSCAGLEGPPNLITIAWCGNINTNPAMLSISVQPARYSYELIVESGEFVVNLPSRAMAHAVDYCGVVSGRDQDKWTATGLTPTPIDGVRCPAVAEAPISIACTVTERLPLGSHDLFLATVEGVMVTADLMDKSGRFRLDRADLLCYAHGDYYTLGERQGHFGWSVRKKKPVLGLRKRRR